MKFRLTEVQLDWVAEDIIPALTEPFMQANEVLGNAFTREISSAKWDWPGETVRKRGKAVVGSPRNIVDQGALRGSYLPTRIPQSSSGPMYSHQWPVGHAMPVHEGAQLVNGGYITPRPWTRDPINKGVLEKAFEKLAKEALSKLPKPSGGA